METFGKYVLGDRIAEGGMGEIYLARLPGLSRPLALKRIRPEHADEPQCIRMFVDEACVLASLRHPNIVEIVDLGVLDGTYYLVMEHVRGVSLEQLLFNLAQKGARPGLHIGLFVVREVASGLAFAHGKGDADGNFLGIVHRDVSPQNILLSTVGEVKIIDFGVAKALKRWTQTSAGMLKGKVPYMSPEQARGAAVDHRSDLFSLGAVLHYVVTGEPIFQARTPLEMLEAVQAGNVTFAPSLAQEAPPALEAILRRALAASPDERYQSGEQMRQDLDALLRTLDYPRQANGRPQDLIDLIWNAAASRSAMRSSGVDAEADPLEDAETSAAVRWGESSTLKELARAPGPIAEISTLQTLRTTRSLRRPDLPLSHAETEAAEDQRLAWLSTPALASDAYPPAELLAEAGRESAAPAQSEEEQPLDAATLARTSTFLGGTETAEPEPLPSLPAAGPQPLVPSSSVDVLASELDGGAGEPAFSMEMQKFDDIPRARKTGMDLARECGMSNRDVMRVGTVISDLARTVLEFCPASELRIRILGRPRPGLRISFMDTSRRTDSAAATNRLGSSRRGMGMGIVAARKLVDHFSIQTGASGETVIIAIKYV